MKLKEVVELLGADLAFGTDSQLAEEVQTAAASDLMSDILARVDVPELLLTRLNNSQVMRTSAVFGIKAVVIVRGRAVDEKMIEIAQEEEIVLLTTPASLFESCGKLYAQGLRSAQPSTDSSRS
ncbi:MAG: hypothetical protein GF330_01195 [Candidatus Eisenbacteria bacterium]|nr:hypothetical protein [Candidatus Eisenbacteria bacterium]